MNCKGLRHISGRTRGAIVRDFKDGYYIGTIARTRNVPWETVREILVESGISKLVISNRVWRERICGTAG